MIVVKPTTIDDSNLDSSTIPEPDASVGEVLWSAGAYAVGDQVIKTTTHRVYQCAVATSDDPEVGVDLDPPTGVDVAPTNKWAMFDNKNSTDSEETTSQMVVEITAGVVTNSVSGFKIFGASAINITVDDPVDGEVYNRDIDMNDNSQVVGMYSYLFSPIIQKRKFTLVDLPAYRNATVTMTVDGSNIEFGSFILGSQIDLGTAVYGSSLDLLDFNNVQTDSFGNTFLPSTAATAKLINFDIAIPEKKTDYAFNVLSDLTNVPTVFIGSTKEYQGMTAFGFYRSFNETLPDPGYTRGKLQIQEFT